MNESIYKYMNIGIVLFSVYPSMVKEDGLIIENMRKVLIDNFFNAIKVSCVKDHKARYKMKEMLEGSYMSVTYGTQPTILSTGININSIDEKERVRALDVLKNEVDEVYFLGAKDVAIQSGEYEENTIEQAYDSLVKSTKELCAYAKQKGMNVVFQVFDNHGCTNSLIGTTSLVKQFAEEILEQYDNFGLYSRYWLHALWV